MPRMFKRRFPLEGRFRMQGSGGTAYTDEGLQNHQAHIDQFNSQLSCYAALRV